MLKHAAPPRKWRQSMHRQGRRRRMGNCPMDETVTLPAGTTIERVGDDGRTHRRTLAQDAVIASDCVGDGAVLLGGWEWAVTDTADWDEWR